MTVHREASDTTDSLNKRTAPVQSKRGNRTSTSFDAKDVRDLLQAQAPAFVRDGALIERCVQRWTRKKLRKQLGEFEVQCRDAATGAPRRLSVIAKQYASERGSSAFRTMCWLESQGFQEPSQLVIARALAYDPERRLLLQEKANGSEMAAALHDDSGVLEERARQAAHWLATLHESDRGDFKRPLVSAVRSIRRRRRELATAFPEHKPRLYDIGERLMQRIRESRHLPAVPTHGDYHPKNIFMDGEQVTVIDLDHFAPREAAADVGYFAGQLAIMAHFNRGRCGVALPAITAFLDTYTARAARPAPWTRIAAHVSRTFVQSLHYELCVLRNQRTELIELWLDHAEAWLESMAPSDVPQLLIDPRRYLSERLGTVRTT